MKRKKKTRKRVREYSYRGCPLTSNRSPWCFRLCAPDAKGNGRCGRFAPHAIKGRTQLAIAAYQKKKLAEQRKKRQA
jgi:hypothetical protein